MAAVKKRLHKAVLIVWDDAEVSNDWEEIPTVEELPKGLVETLGFLIRETKDYYLIASTFDGTLTNARTKIPKGMVQTIKEIKL